MSSWSNAKAQIVSTSGAIAINFPVSIIPGNNPLVQGGNHTYNYHLNLVKPSGENGPTPITAVLTINNVAQEYTRSFAEIDTGAKEFLCHTGELQQLQIDDSIGVRVKTDPDALVDPTLQIRTLSGRCTLTLRRVTGQGT